MAKRSCFISRENEFPIYKEIVIEFKYYNGFAISQKQKSINSLHESIKSIDNTLRVLEVSTKSTSAVGVSLSAFNLKFFETTTGNEYPLENIFQSSKVFERGGPYRDLLNVHPREAKRDERLKSSGRLIHFDYCGDIWAREPKTMFYDWIYISSLYRNKSLSEKILEYNAFTDIEFNHEKSINCQARAAAIFVSLEKNEMLESVLKNQAEFKKIYKTNEQISFLN